MSKTAEKGAPPPPPPPPGLGPPALKNESNPFFGLFRAFPIQPRHGSSLFTTLFKKNFFILIIYCKVT